MNVPTISVRRLHTEIRAFVPADNQIWELGMKMPRIIWDYF